MNEAGEYVTQGYIDVGDGPWGRNVLTDIGDEMCW